MGGLCVVCAVLCGGRRRCAPSAIGIARVEEYSPQRERRVRH